MPRHTRAMGFSPGGPQQLDEHGRPETQKSKRNTRKQTRLASIQTSETPEEPASALVQEPEPAPVDEESRGRGRAKRTKGRATTRSISPPATRQQPPNRRTRSPYQRKPRKAASKKSATPEPAPQAKSPPPVSPVVEVIQEIPEDDEPVAADDVSEEPLRKSSNASNVNALAKLAAVPKEVEKAPSECDSEEGIQLAAKMLAGDNSNGSNALSASLNWFESHPEARVPRPDEMEQLLDNYSQLSQPALPSSPFSPYMSGALAVPPSEPSTPRIHPASHTAVYEPPPSAPTASPQNPQNSSWANALSVPNFLRTPFSRLTSSIFGRQNAPATDGRVRRTMPSTPSRVSSSSTITPNASRDSAPISHPATVAHQPPKRVRTSYNTYHPQGSQATPKARFTVTKANERDTRLPVHLRGVRYEDLPPEYQAMSPHLKQSEMNTEPRFDLDDEEEVEELAELRKKEDNFMEQRRLKIASRRMRNRAPNTLSGSRGGEPAVKTTPKIVSDQTTRNGEGFPSNNTRRDNYTSARKESPVSTFTTTPLIGQKRKKWVSRPKVFEGKIGPSTYGMPVNIDDSSDEEMVEVTMTEGSLGGLTPTSKKGASDDVEGSPTPKARKRKSKNSVPRMPGQFESDSSFLSNDSSIDTSSPPSKPQFQFAENPNDGLPYVSYKDNPKLAEFWDSQRRYAHDSEKKTAAWEKKQKEAGVSSTGAKPAQNGVGSNKFTPQKSSFTPRSGTRTTSFGNKIIQRGANSPSPFQQTTARVRGAKRAAATRENDGEFIDDSENYSHFGDPHRARPYFGDLVSGGRFPPPNPEAEGKARNMFDTHGVIADSNAEIRNKNGTSDDYPIPNISNPSVSSPQKRKRNDGHPAPGTFCVPSPSSDSDSSDGDDEPTPHARSGSPRVNQEWLNKHPEERYWNPEKAISGEYIRKEAYKRFFENGVEIHVDGLSPELQEAVAWKHFTALNPSQKYIFDGKTDYARAERLENLYWLYIQELDEKRAKENETAEAAGVTLTQTSVAGPTGPRLPQSTSTRSTLPSKPSVPASQPLIPATPKPSAVDPAHQEKLERMRAAAEQHKPKTPSRLREAQVPSPSSTHSSLPSPTPAVTAAVSPLKSVVGSSIEQQHQPVSREAFEELLAKNLQNDMAVMDAEVQNATFAVPHSGLSQVLANDGAKALSKENIPPTDDQWYIFDAEVNEALEGVFGMN